MIMNTADFTTRHNKSLTPFWQANLLNATLYGLLVLSIVFFMSYPWKTNIASYMRQGKGPFIFFPVFAAAAVIYTYLNMRCGKGEFVVITACVDSYNETLPPLVCAEEEHGVFRYALPIFLLHTLFLLLPSLPILLLATAISGLPFSSCWIAIGMIFVTALCARWFGFLLLLLFGHGSMFAYFATRIMMTLLLVATVSTTPAYNLMLGLYELHGGASGSAVWWSNEYARYAALMAVCSIFLAVLCQIQQKRRQQLAARQQQPAQRRKHPHRG